MAGKKKAEEQEQRSLEENFSELEELIEQLEAEDISLEDAFTAYSKGMNVLKQCNEQIDRVEKQVMKLNEEGRTGTSGSAVNIPAGRGRTALTWKKRYSDRNYRRERQQ